MESARGELPRLRPALLGDAIGAKGTPRRSGKDPTKLVERGCGNLDSNGHRMVAQSVQSKPPMLGEASCRANVRPITAPVSSSTIVRKIARRRGDHAAMRPPYLR